jgi:hypothetical protein
MVKSKIIKWKGFPKLPTTLGTVLQNCDSVSTTESFVYRAFQVPFGKLIGIRFHSFSQQIELITPSGQQMNTVLNTEQEYLLRNVFKKLKFGSLEPFTASIPSTITMWYVFGGGVDDSRSSNGLKPFCYLICVVQDHQFISIDVWQECYDEENHIYSLVILKHIKINAQNKDTQQKIDDFLNKDLMYKYLNPRKRKVDAGNAALILPESKLYFNNPNTWGYFTKKS